MVVGLVGAVGTDLDAFEKTLRKLLRQFSYETSSIRLTNFLGTLRFGGETLPRSPEGERIRTHMDAGNALRQDTGRNDMLALYAASEIARIRSGAKSARIAYVLRSLKHPDEVHTLRRTYGPGFFLVAVFSDEQARLNYLINEKNVPRREAEALINRDQEDPQEHGQQTRKTFALADAFVSSSDATSLGRMLDVFFGKPHETPNQDEYAMFMAYSSALRSGDLSRQVGAVVVNASGDLIATGANDVPKFGGGLYWPGRKDMRDHVIGYDANERARNDAIVEIMRRVSPGKSKRNNATLLRDGLQRLERTLLLDITEFGRAVHAEMEALMCCARSGAIATGGTVYTTTFPCHNCAKHIVAAGIRRVVFIEPYAKSRARELHGDSIAVERSERNKVLFEPFVGLGPRRFVDLYSMSMGTGYKLIRKIDGRRADWHRRAAQPRVPMLPNSYIERESLASREFVNATRKIL